MIVLLIRGPFARFQPLSAGTYRATMRFMPHSAAYGLVLHLAGIESRLEDPRFSGNPGSAGPSSGEVSGRGGRALPGRAGWLPADPQLPRRDHAGKDHAADCFGQKYNVQFVKREYLTDLNAAIAVEAGEELIDRIREGVLGGTSRAGDNRGVVFLGDRDFEASHISVSDKVPASYWYEPVSRDQRIGDVRHSTYLTVRIDRSDSSKTISKLFCPVSTPTSEIPAEAWQDCFQAPERGG